IAASHNGTFLFSDYYDNKFTSAAANEFAVRARGGVRFVTATDFYGAPTAGVQLSSGGGSWSSISDRNAKTNFAFVDGLDIVSRLAEIPVQTWNYKSQETSIRHIGPMAQDFAAAFAVGEDDKHITTVDADGVALAGIQGLNEGAKEQDAKIAALEQRVAELEKMLRAVAEEHSGGVR